MTDFAADLRALADRAATLDPAEIVGAVVVLGVRALQAALAHAAGPPRPPEPAHEITQQEAAKLRPALGLKRIRFLTSTERVPSVPTGTGRQRLVRLADLDAYVDRCRTQGVALGVLRDVAPPHDRRRGAQYPPTARADTTPVRRGRRGPA